MITKAKRTSGEWVVLAGRTANVVSLVAVAVIACILAMTKATHNIDNYNPIQFVNYANAYGLAFIATVFAVTRGVAGYAAWLFFLEVKRWPNTTNRRRTRVFALVVELALLIAGFIVALVGRITTHDIAPWVVGTVLVVGLLAQDVCAVVGAELDEKDTREPQNTRPKKARNPATGGNAGASV